MSSSRGPSSSPSLTADRSTPWTADAGLTVEAVHVEANVLTPTLGYPFSALLRAVLPRITEPGIAAESEVDPDTLDQRLAQERREFDATVVWELIFGAWARTS